MSIIANWEQQPAERLDWDVYYRNSPDGREDLLDAGDYLDDTKTVVTVTPAGLVVEPLTLRSTDRVKLWVSGGVSGVKYKIEITVTTDLARTKQNEVIFKIKDD